MHKTLRTCGQLLEEYEKTNSSKNSSSRLRFLLGERYRSKNGGYKDVYNVTAPFEWDGKTLLAGRVEERDSEHSEVVFFEQKEAGWEPVSGAPVFELQDPFVTKVGEWLVMGGVEVFPDEENPNALCWRTAFYKGKKLTDLRLFAKGPDRMKDIRLLELSDGRILVAVRPQGEIGGRGKIGFLVVKSLDELTKERMESAPVLEGQFVDEEWGGCNEMHLLQGGRIGVLSHIACFDAAGNRHYYASCFVYDVSTGEYTPMKMIARRSDFEPGESKRPDLADVIFSGGLVRRKDGTAQLYCGVGDAQAHMRLIKDPFLER